MDKEKIVVMKFGGSVLKDADGFRRAAEIIKAEKRKKIVVVSAMAGVTDELYKLANEAIYSKRTNMKKEYLKAATNRYEEILSKHLKILRELNIKHRPDRFNEIAIHLEKMIEIIGYTKEVTPCTVDAVVSQGEKFSANILSALIDENDPCIYVPATKIIKLFPDFDGRHSIHDTATKEDLLKYTDEFLTNRDTLVTEGFIGSNLNEQIFTLGRNGSDYTAAIIGSLLPQVEEVQFWKDVPGVMTVDPKLTMLATPLSSISYDEIIEATRLGAKILHPEAIAPLFETNEKRVVIKNVNAPRALGTQIVKKSLNKNPHGVTMLTVERDLGIFSIRDSAKSVEYLTPKIYLALRQANVEFATVTQGFSDQNATIIVHKNDFEKTRKVIDQITGNKLTLVFPAAQISVIGSNMRGKPGIAGRFFTALGKAGVNIINIQQGSSECSMAATINKEDVDKAIVAVHDAFDLTKPY